MLYLHLVDVGEISGADVMLSLQDGVDLWQSHDQLLLLLLPSEESGHLLLQVADDVGVHLEDDSKHQAGFSAVDPKVLSAEELLTGSCLSEGHDPEELLNKEDIFKRGS